MTTEYGKAKLQTAINAMRDFLDDAEQSVRRDDITDLEAARRVMQAIGWGAANALSQVETCIANAERQYHTQQPGA